MLVNEILKHWPGTWNNLADANAPHEADRLRIATDKATVVLGWNPTWGIEKTVEHTVNWYRAWADGANEGDLLELMRVQIGEFEKDARWIGKCPTNDSSSGV